MAITEYYNNLRQLIHLNLQVPVYSESTFENQNVSLPCIVFSRQGTLGSQTMNGPSVNTETVTFSAKAKTIEKAEEMRDFIISILNGYNNEIQMVLNSEVDDFDINTSIYSRDISFDVVYGADIAYVNVVIGEGTAGQVAVWKDRYILTGSNAMSITGSTVTFTGSVVVNGTLTVAGGFVAQNAISSSYSATASTSSYSNYAVTASYALNAAGGSGTSGTSGIDGSSGTSGTSGINGSSGTSGSSGSSGTSGSSGSSGTSGSSGSSGTSGITPTSISWDNITDISTSSSFAGTASYANYALTASYAMNGGGGAPSSTASYLLGNASSSLVQFAETVNAPDAVGQLAWNSDLGTLKLGLGGGNVNIPLGMEEVAYVYNAEATTLNKGEVVYASGSVTDRIAVKRANASADATSARTLGIVAETITSGGSGYITTRGLVSNINTSTYNAGDILYVSTSSGQLTNVKQLAPTHLVYAGIVTRVGVANGSIFTLVQNGYELDEIHDVRATAPVAGDLLVYSSSGLWENTKNNINITGSLQGTASFSSNTQYLITSGSGLVVGNAAATAVVGVNTVVGINAGAALATNGSENTLVGASAGAVISSGDFNVAIGNGASGFANTTGNTAVGYVALRRSSGNDNVAVGRSAGAGFHGNSPFSQSLTTGTASVFIGAFSGVQSGSGASNNTIVIGYGALSKGSNTTLIGNDNTTQTYLMGQVTASSANITSMTGSLLGTASYANAALTASYATTALTASYVKGNVSASFIETAQILVTGNDEQIISGNVKLPNTLTVKDVTIPTGGSIINNGTFTSFYGTAQFGNLTATSITASLQGTASYARNALSSSYSVSASSVPYSGVTGIDSNSYFAGIASYANLSSFATSASTASFLTGSRAVVSQLTASNANITVITASEMYAAGTNVFGDASNDVHRFVGSVQMTGSVKVTGSLEVLGNAIPAADGLYSLGSPTRRWKDLYVGSASIYVGDVKLTDQNNGTLSIQVGDGPIIALPTSSNAISASVSISSSYSQTADSSTTASYALVAGSVPFAATASSAVTASYAFEAQNAATASYTLNSNVIGEPYYVPYFASNTNLQYSNMAQFSTGQFKITGSAFPEINIAGENEFTGESSAKLNLSVDTTYPNTSSLTVIKYSANLTGSSDVMGLDTGKNTFIVDENTNNLAIAVKSTGSIVLGVKNTSSLEINGSDTGTVISLKAPTVITGSLVVTGQVSGNGSGLTNIGYVNKVFYVSEQGNDNNDGKSLSTAFKTIRKAAQEASASYVANAGPSPYRMSIHIKTGTYTETGSIWIAPWTSLLGDDLRTTVVKPTTATKGQNLFLMNNGTYAYGLRLEGCEIDDLENPRNGFFFAFAPSASISTSPYIQNCSAIFTPADKFYVPLDSGSNPPNPLVGNGPGGMIVDDSVLDPYSPLKSMIVDSYTQVAFNGIGLCVRGRGYAQQVSFFTNFSRVGIFAMDGGHASLLNSNTTFGDFGLRASGSRILVVPDIDTISGSIDISGSTILTTEKNSIKNYMIGQLQTYGWYSASYQDTGSAIYAATMKDAGLLVDALAADLIVPKAARISNFLQNEFKGQDTSVGKIYTLPPATGFTRGAVAAFRVNDSKHLAMDYTSSYQYIKDYIINDPDNKFGSMTSQGKDKVEQMLNLAIDVIRSVAIDVEPTYLQEFGSLITSTSHDFSYAGSGVNFLGLPTNQGGVGQTNTALRVYEEAGGRVYQTSGDETGDFFAGNGFVIRQSTGTIEGRSFDKSTQARIVPLNLALET